MLQKYIGFMQQLLYNVYRNNVKKCLSMSKTMGYCRVGSIDKNETCQILKMKALDVENRYIFVDKQSGKDCNRLEYQFLGLLSYVAEQECKKYYIYNIY